MPAKQIRFDTEARQLLRRGVDAVADAVAVTLGPRGRAVVLDKKFGPPLVTSDGVTVARDLDFKDHFENMGAQLLREVAVKTNDIAGDGTTTATVLSRAMIVGGLRLLSAGAFPTELRNGMLAASDAAAASVRARSHPLDTNDDIRRIATISAGDEEIGTMLADAFAKVGREGVVSVESADGMETTVEVVEGMQFDRGYLSAYLVTDQKAMIAELEKPFILITEAKISAVSDLLPVLELTMAERRPCSSSPRTSPARPWPPSWSTACAAPSPPSPSRRPASATGARRCSRTSPPSPGRRWSARRSACASIPSRPAISATPTG